MSSKGSKLASDVKFYLDYSKWQEEKLKAETWIDSTDRVMGMHRTNPKLAKAFENPKFVEYFTFADKLYKEKYILGSQRALQFGGSPMMKHQMKMYNCTSSYVDRLEFFNEAFYILLCGCGVGASIQKRHIDKLPEFTKRERGTKTHIIEDSIEGWSDALGILLSSFATSQWTHKEYRGYVIHFDYSQIRPIGSEISGGFKAPGPDGLRSSLEKIESILNNAVSNGITKLRPIQAYDILMHTADAVLSGGVRRSATIVVFDKDDQEMITAKTGNWYIDNPQRGRSNNSVILLRDEIGYEEFKQIFESIKQFGEPGFLFVDDLDQLTNPCVEIGMVPYLLVKGEKISGWQGCNLTEGNGGKCTTKQKFLDVCKGLAILGTIQASYTDFKYVKEVTRKIFEKEALLGCSITGWMANPQILFDEEILKEGAKLIKEINKEVAEMIGINQAARTTCAKPSGNASVLLETPSGIHGDHAKRYFRNMQINKESEIAKLFIESHSYMYEESLWSQNNTDIVVSFPVVSTNNAKFKKDLIGVNLLEFVKKAQMYWVEEGTNVELCTIPTVRHNISNTIDVIDFDKVCDYIFENKKFFSGISMLRYGGDKDYVQAPFQAVLDEEEIIHKYGAAGILASGLIMDGLNAFDDNLWKACSFSLDMKDKKMPIDGTRLQVMVKKDWLRRSKQFAKRFFKGDILEMTYCLKDIHLFHRWTTINRELKTINLEDLNLKPEYTEIDTLGSIACQNGACEMPAEYLAKFKNNN